MLSEIKKFTEHLINTHDITDTNNYHIIYKLLIDEFYYDKDTSIYKINFVFYDKFNIDPTSCDLSNKLNKLCNERIGQTIFRNNLIKLYTRCIISDDDADVCQACHIIPYSETQNNDINNGLLLNYNLHHLFDNFVISFKYLSNLDNLFDVYAVIFSEKIKGKETYKNFLIYNDKLVKINKNSKKNLDIKYKQFNSKNILIKD